MSFFAPLSTKPTPKRCPLPPRRAIDQRLVDVGLEIGGRAGGPEHEHAGKGRGDPRTCGPRVVQCLHRAGDDERDGGEGDLDGVGDIEEGLGQPGEGVGAGREDGLEGGDDRGVRQGEMGGRDGGEGFVQHDDLSSGTEIAPVKDRA